MPRNRSPGTPKANRPTGRGNKGRPLEGRPDGENRTGRQWPDFMLARWR